MVTVIRLSDEIESVWERERERGKNVFINLKVSDDTNNWQVPGSRRQRKWVYVKKSVCFLVCWEYLDIELKFVLVKEVTGFLLDNAELLSI